jgi:predicted dehydrogenase
MVKIGVIGYGYWGPNLVRNFFNTDGCQVKTVVDLNPERLKTLKKTFPSINVSRHLDDILNDRRIDAVVIATPVKTHYQIAKSALEAGKHVLVEKPMTNSLKTASLLVDLADKKNRILMVDHTFLYTSAVAKIKSLIDDKKIGKLQYFDSMRTNLGIFQKDINVLWDLASHDISILTYLVDEKPLTIQAVGTSHTKLGIENIAFLIIKYRSGLIAHFNSSWSSPVKLRLILVGGTKKMIVYDDVEPTEKIKVYDYGYKLVKNKNKTKTLIDYRVGDIHIPKVELKEALGNMTIDFINAVSSGKTPISNAMLSLKVVKILTLANKSLKNDGRPVEYS